jgi:hypothetical protein
MGCKIPSDEPGVLTYVRVGYVVSQIAILAVYYFISYKVRSHPLPAPFVRVVCVVG